MADLKNEVHWLDAAPHGERTKRLVNYSLLPPVSILTATQNARTQKHVQQVIKSDLPSTSHARVSYWHFKVKLFIYPSASVMALYSMVKIR